MLDHSTANNVNMATTPNWVSQKAQQALWAYEQTHGPLRGWARDAFLAVKRRAAIAGHTPPSTQTSAH